MLTDNDPSADWILRQGQAMALMVGLAVAPKQIMDSGLKDSVEKTIPSLVASDRVCCF